MTWPWTSKIIISLDLGSAIGRKHVCYLLERSLREETLNGGPSLGTLLLLSAPQIYWTFVAFCCQLKVEICFLYSTLKYFNICCHLLPIENWNLFQTPSALSPCNTNSRAPTALLLRRCTRTMDGPNHSEFVVVFGSSRGFLPFTWNFKKCGQFTHGALVLEDLTLES